MPYKPSCTMLSYKYAATCYCTLRKKGTKKQCLGGVIFMSAEQPLLGTYNRASFFGAHILFFFLHFFFQNDS